LIEYTAKLYPKVKVLITAGNCISMNAKFDGDFSLRNTAAKLPKNSVTKAVASKSVARFNSLI
jgi:hypothetical protein